MILTKDQIFSADDLKRELVEVPEWGGDIYISTLTAKDRDAFEHSLMKMDAHNNMRQDFTNMRAKLVGRTAVDEGGKRIFSDSDVNELGKKSAAALDRCYSVASRLNGMSDDDLEAIAKNS